MSAAGKYDIIIFGATGFTGRLAALYVTKQYGKSIRWAIAGRSESKLASIKRECQDIPDIVVADSGDAEALKQMVARTKVVVTFAGPFARYGSKLVEACAAAGVDYCDITGESDWVRDMIAKHDDQAKASGAHIVHLCGHDCLPWDITTMMLAKKLKEQGAGELKSIEFWDDIKSSPSGGTLETAFGIMFGAEGKIKKSEEQKALGFDPLTKSLDGSQSTCKTSAQNVSFLELADSKKDHNAVRTMFFMAGVNANAVKRSNALNKYGQKLTYREGQEFSGVCGAVAYMTGIMALGVALYIPPLRWLLQKYVLYKPGEGPSEEYMESGYLNVTGVATAMDGRTAKATMRFPVDPGYKDTARMAVESGLALSLEGSRLSNVAGGVLTPAACQGEVVLERLLKTGSTFDYLDTGGNE